MSGVIRPYAASESPLALIGNKPARPPVVILCAQIAALGLARTFGRQGIAVGMMDQDPNALAFSSRYCRVAGCAPADLHDDATIGRLNSIADRLGDTNPVLVSTSDDFLLLMSRNRDRLARRFRFLLPAADLLETLIDKRRMRALAVAHGLPAPRDVIVSSEGELEQAAREIGFPCLLKSAFTKLAGKSSDFGKVRVDNLEQLKRAYAAMSALDARIIVQEYLAGSCERIGLYNAYFDALGRPIAVFTGVKVRQYPVEFGTASMSECRSIPELALLVTEFLQSVGYRGPVDMGLKYDPRDGRYKVFDINPRIGQNYRNYIADDGSDLGTLAYQELIGESPYRPGQWRTSKCVRRWFIEDNDWRSSRELRQRGELTWFQWARSLVRVREGAYTCWHDPMPALKLFRRIRANRARPGQALATATRVSLFAAEVPKVEVTVTS